jgi:peptide/nickel transport system substrate-binding protein
MRRTVISPVSEAFATGVERSTRLFRLQDPRTIMTRQAGLMHTTSHAIAVGLLALAVASGVEAAQEGVFVYHLNGQPDNLDPAKCSNQRCQRVMWPIFERLMDLSADAKTLVPGLAEKWVSADGLTYTLSLRKGVTFHDGSPFNAMVARANLERNYLKTSPFYMANGRNVREQYLTGLIAGLKVQDEHTLVVALKEPALDLLYLVPMVSLNALESARREKKRFVDPIGTGPFKFLHQTPEEVRLEAYQGYWGGRPKLREIVFKIIPESLGATREFLAGGIDFLPELEPLYRSRIRAHPAARIIPPVETLSLYYLGFRADRGPLSDVRVRQAIVRGINVERIVERLLEDMANTAYGPLPPGVEGYDGSLKQPPHDLQAARKLLRESGHAGSLRLTLLFNKDWEYFRQLAVAIQDDLAKAGVRVALVPLAGYGELVRAVRRGEADLFIYNWFFPLANPRAWLEPLFHGTSVDNLGHYRNPGVDALLEKARAAIDPSTRIELYRTAQRAIVADAPMAFLFHDLRVSAHNTRVRDLELNNQSWPIDRFRRTEVGSE